MSSEQDQWYAIRAMFIGRNGVQRNFKEALQLAKMCAYPEARWLTELFVGKEDISTRSEARLVLLQPGRENDAAALCFGAMLSVPLDEVRLRRSAELGYAYAQAVMADRISRGEERFLFASSAAKQGERNGFRWLGACYEHGEGCERDLDKARANYEVAAKQGFFPLLFFFCSLLVHFKAR